LGPFGPLGAKIYDLAKREAFIVYFEALAENDGKVSSTMQIADPNRNAKFTSNTDGNANPIQVGDVESEMINLLDKSLNCCNEDSYKNADQPACPIKASIHAN